MEVLRIQHKYVQQRSLVIKEVIKSDHLTIFSEYEKTEMKLVIPDSATKFPLSTTIATIDQLTAILPSANYHHGHTCYVQIQQNKKLCSNR